MKKSFIALAIAATCTVATAQHVSQKPVRSVPTEVAEGVVAIVLGPVLVPVAAFTGNLDKLCNGLDGKYVSGATDRCPDGS